MVYPSMAPGVLISKSCQVFGRRLVKGISEFMTGLENLERSTTNDRNKRANASSCRNFFSANGVAAA